MNNPSLKPPSYWFDRFFPRAAAPAGICPECGHEGAPVRTKRGRDDLETVLWALLVVALAGYLGLNVIDRLIGIVPGFVIHMVTTLGKALLVVDLVYTVWRLSTEYEACGKCSREGVVPPDSPRGQKIRSEISEKS